MMIQSSIDPSFSLLLAILCFIATGALVMIVWLLLIMNSKISVSSAKLSRTSRLTQPQTYERTQGKMDSPQVDENRNMEEIPAGTHYEQFLNEEPERRRLPKKEKFKAYRAWRTEKGLNWSK